MTDLNDICSYINSFNDFIYRANGGNLGDMIISCSEFQMFDKINAKYRLVTRKNNQSLMSKPFDLVYGGGGGWVNCQKYKLALNMFIKNKNLKRCIILPSSFYKCNDVINSFDNRFIVFCRDKKSYEYCVSLNSKAKFLLHNDMAFQLDISKLNKNLLRTDIQLENIKKAYDKIEIFLKSRTSFKIGKFIRTDAEKTNIIVDSAENFDLSNIFILYGLDVTRPIVERTTELMIHCLQKFDCIETNRLHISIMAYLLGKNVKMHDNSYGKLKNVYEFSMKNFQNISFE